MLYTTYIYRKLLTFVVAHGKLHSVEGVIIFIVYVNFVRLLH
jgi:hypothetical protein